MRLIINDQIANILAVEANVTRLTISDFDTGFGKIPYSVFTGKGQILVASAAGIAAALSVGADNTVLTADSTQLLGVKWSASSGAAASASLKNNSGLNVAANDVIALDTADDESFKLSSIAGDRTVIGVAGAAILAGDTGVCYTFPGMVVTVNCDTVAISRGMFLKQSGTIRLATPDGYFKTPSSFAVALTEKAAGVSGTVRALLVPNIVQGTTGTYGYALGGSPITTNSQKFTMASGLWATVAAAALPAARSTQSGVSDTTVRGYSIGGYDGSTHQATAYIVNYATDAAAAQASANLTTARQRFRSGHNAADRGYSPGGYTTANLATVDKVTFATLLDAVVSSLSAISAQRCGGSNGTHIYTVGNLTPVNRIVVATDTPGAYTDANFTADANYVSLAFPNSAAYWVTATLSFKVPFATGVYAAGPATVSGNDGAGSVTDGVAIGYNTGNDSVPHDISDKFTLATEVWANDAAAVLAAGKYSFAYMSNGAL